MPGTPSFTVLHLTSGSDAGGISRYLLDLSAALNAEGVRSVIAGERGQWHSRFEGGPWRWIDVPMRAGYLSLRRVATELARELGEDSPDIIHAHYRKASIVGRALQRRLGRGRAVPLLYTLHLTDMPMGFPWRMLSDFGDFAHAPSEQARRWLTGVGRVPAERVFLIPHGVDVQRFAVRGEAEMVRARGRLGLSSSDLVVAYVGRLEDPKNEGWLLDVLAEKQKAESRKQKKEANVMLLVAGDGPNRSAFEAKASSLGLTGRVRMLGDCDPVPVYQAADALLLPSAREGFSYACAEAMSCGVPVLRTRTAGTEEMIVEGVTGRSCEIEHDAFVTAAGEFLADRERLRTMGNAAARHIREHLTFDRQVADTLALYRRLAGRG